MILRDYAILYSGRIYSLKTNKFLKPQGNGNGYLKVSLRIEGKTVQQYVHRLVALTYLKYNPSFPEVDHIDGDKHNNHADNLRWVNRSQNSKNFKRTSRKGYSLKTVPKDIKLLICDLSINAYMTSVEISKLLLIPRQTVHSIIKVGGINV